MSFYELAAEGRGYFYFAKRDANDTFAHFHSTIEMLFVKSGKQEVVVDGERFELNEGEACFLDSFCVHSCTGLQEGATVYALLGDRSYFEKFFHEKNGYTLPKRFSFKNFSLLEAFYDLCNNLDKNSWESQLIFSGVVCILLGTILQETSPVERKDDKQETFVCEILKYAQENPAADLSLAELSVRFGYSREHLSRMLHRYLNENWTDYVNRLRVEKAKWLIKERGDKNVLEILYECGFNSPNTFYRAYKKEFSTCPRNGK